MAKRGASNSVQAYLRVRPLNDEELKERQDSCLVVNKDGTSVKVNVSDGSSEFPFEKVFDQGTSQPSVYDCVASPLVSEFLAGRDCCLMAYGEVGSGKTYTMFGRVNLGDDDNGNDDGNDFGEDDSCVSSLGSTGASEARPRRRGSLDSSKKNVHPPSSVYAAKSYHPPLHPSISRSGKRAQVPGQLLTPQQKMFGGREKAKKSEELSSEDNGARKDLCNLHEEAGIVPRAVSAVFASLLKKRRGERGGGDRRRDTSSLRDKMESTADFSVSCAYVAVYFENIIDLLAEHEDEPETPPPGAGRVSHSPSLKSLSVKEDPSTGKISIGGDIEHACSDEEKVFALLRRGAKFRQSTQERMNIDLSRSHTMFSMSIKHGDKKSRLDFVDLAGHQSSTKRTSKSLAALENVVYALSESHDAHVPYRDSTLTKALREHLGGNSSTRILITVNPTSCSAVETVSTMRFGKRVKRIINGPRKEESKLCGDGKSSDRSSRVAGILDSVGVGSRKSNRQVDHNDNTSKQASSASGESARTTGKVMDLGLSSPKSDQLSAKQMEEDLALARVELTTVSSLLRSAAKRMEADLTMARDEFSAPAPFGQTAQQIETDLKVTKDNLSMKELPSSQQPLHLTARQIELDLEAARRELMGVTTDLDMDKDTSIASITADLTGSSSAAGKSCGATGVSVSELKKKDQLLAAMEREISSLRKEKEVLNRIKNSREEELSRARKDIQVLTLRATDAEKELARLQNGEGGKKKADNWEVSNIVGSHIHSTSQLRQRDTSIEEENIDIDAFPNGSNIRVCLRLRPMSKLETSRRSRSCFEIHECSRNFTVDSHLDGEYDFCFDQVFDTNVSQSELYNDIGLGTVSDLLSGINCALMTYGLTSTGKTYTLMGSLPDVSLRDNDLRDRLYDDMVEDESAGIAPRLINDLFKSMEKCVHSTEFTIRCSYVSVYLEKIYDILQPQAKKSLFVRESPKGIQIEGATTALCYDKTDVFALLQRGKASLSVLATRMNMDKNRLHSMFTIKVEQRNTETGALKYSQLLLAELAGFDLSGRSKGQTMQETKIVQRSFSSLANVIRALTENKPHAPYRDSKLTCGLKDALGGNCKSTLIITASPSSYTISETLNAMRLGQRVRRIVNTPRVNWDINVEDYKNWLMLNEIQFGELVAFVKELSGELCRDGDNTIINASKVLSADVWGTINAISERENVINNPCREAFCLGDMETLKGCGLKWKALSTKLFERIPSDELSAVVISRDKARSLLSDINSEIIVLRRQNELLVADKRKKMEELSSSKKDMKLLTLRIAELEHNLGLSEYRLRQAMAFLQHLRKLCWSLRKDVSEGRTLAIDEVTSCLNEVPDLSGLVDLDSLMLDMGLIETLHLNDDDEDLPNGSMPRGLSESNAAEANMGRPLQMVDTRDTDIALPSPGNRVDSSAELELRRDLRKMTNKCVELQMLLNEEKTNVEILTNRSGSIKHKQLGQDVMTLRREKVRMTENAKAALWKLQELQIVNKMLANKSNESSHHVSFLEEGFQRLQETFRTTVLDSLDADSQLRERVASLESVVDSLTVPQNQTIELDALSRPVPRMNIPVRGQLVLEKAKEKMEESSPSRCLMMVPTIKMPENTPAFIVRRKSKHNRRSKKMGTAPKRPVTNVGGLRVRCKMQRASPQVPPKFGGNLQL
uniref:Kinesin motor domain-containing protein n=1 Tax=Odontella aurita TaxID=265563 RepID=A0A7S4J4X1_9STRA|mmetsp:Transcript_38576/g.115789  ORF Transcript_38576/g.115789 Transcript_38576/m.115789 type:complete len:1678 (+) Transcript_38576:75-5108(+)